MENKKHIAILFPSTKGGGVYQYTLSIAESLIAYSDNFRFSIIYYEDEERPVFFNSNKGRINYIPIPNKKHSNFRKVLHFLGLVLRINLFVIKDFSNYLKDKHIDLLIVSTPFSYDIPLISMLAGRRSLISLIFLPFLMKLNILNPLSSPVFSSLPSKISSSVSSKYEGVGSPIIISNISASAS